MIAGWLECNYAWGIRKIPQLHAESIIDLGISSISSPQGTVGFRVFGPGLGFTWYRYLIFITTPIQTTGVSVVRYKTLVNMIWCVR